jgi:hypothetical protein
MPRQVGQGFERGSNPRVDLGRGLGGEPSALLDHGEGAVGLELARPEPGRRLLEALRELDQSIGHGMQRTDTEDPVAATP